MFVLLRVMTKLYVNIGWLGGLGNITAPLRGEDLKKVEGLHHAWLLCTNGIISDYGPMPVPLQYVSIAQTDLQQRVLIPGFADSHTHLVFASTRENEFVLKIKGAGYAEIAASGGGILHSAHQLQQVTEEVLYNLAMERLQRIIKTGTVAVEIKTGYGLTTESELKMLRVINRIQKTASIAVKRTLLAAHSIPLSWKSDPEGYVSGIINELIPQAAGLADYIDVFCEQGFFSNEQMIRLAEAGARYGMKPKIHANQLSCTGAVEAAVYANALSADHLEQMNESAVQILAASGTIGTMLPTAAWFIRLPFPPALEMIKAGAALALASDFNPGSSPSGNMQFVMSMACIQMRMLPEEAFNAATINGAFAMDLAHSYGSFYKGKIASGMVLPAGATLSSLAYHFGGLPGIQIMQKGELSGM